jgi:hypothetical protein
LQEECPRREKGNMKKVFVSVITQFDADGRVTPLKILWQDGREFEVDRILEVRKASSVKVGGQGFRYTCGIQGKEAFLFLEEGRWFVEGK